MHASGKQLIFALFCFVLIINLNAQTVTEWRGKDRTGVYAETGLLKEWPALGPELLWSKADLPTGYSSVIVTDKSIFVTGRKDTMDILVAMDKSGKELWRVGYGRAWMESFPESRCTPTFENDKLFLTSGKGDLACVNAINGEIIWSVKASEIFEGSFGNWGIAESPLIIDNKFIFTPGGNKTTTIALDKLTGKLIWKSESLNDKPGYTSPIYINHNGNKQIVNVTETYIYAVSPADGKIIWKFDFLHYTNPDNGDINTNTPLYYKGGVFVSAGYNHCAVMLKLSEDGNSVSPLWSSLALDTHHGGYLRIGEYIYGSNWLNNGMGNWVCLDWNTGKTMYETEWFNKGPIISDGEMLYCQDEKKGNIGLAKASPEGFVVTSTFKIPLGTGPYWPHPVICGGVLYVRHGAALMVYDIKMK